MAQEATVKLKTNRSPVYPAIPLGEALEKMALIYKAIQKSEAPDIALLAAMNYKGPSGTSLPVMGALKGFGLIESPYGSGKSKVSPLALKILLDQREDGTDKLAAIRQAALNPPMHAHMWEKYGKELPDDKTLLFHLTLEKHFTDAGAASFVKEYRSTFAYANLSELAKMPEGDSGGPREEIPREEKPKDDSGFVGFFGPLKKNSPPAPPVGGKPDMNQDTFTLDEGQVILQWPSRISPASYEDLKDWLDLMARRLKRAVAEPEEKLLSNDPAGADKM